MQQKPGKGFAVNTDYKVVISEGAAQDLGNCINYLINIKKNPQAALSVMNDYDDTIAKLSIVAGSLKPCQSPKMKERNLRRINFLRHNYFMLYLVEGQTAYVTNIFHDLEDADNKLL